ncbi:hypothetical protein [cf. Phormidesmis sp. LEGE 11477]|uniref:hypothetical protein n=1 Tax=cf. Phormidesmis sp. LEGE 11477 TaxID=1828680 RepID=UPI00188005D0|nr:hypothetical protein [cf. Phormidesmis sp. LEGE 11477]MBE9063897.1 hypothetical protein [cf. Phormidesmis sp. LEGE 11477]
MTVDRYSSKQQKGKESLDTGTADSWLATCRSLMGHGTHKPSFVVFELGQSGCMTLVKWFRDRKDIIFQEDILSQQVRFPRLSVFQRVQQSHGEVYGFNLRVEHLRQAQTMSNPNQFLQDLHRGGCRVIYLQRRDVLRHAIATLKADSVQSSYSPSNSPSKKPSSSSPSSRAYSSRRIAIRTQALLGRLERIDTQRTDVQAILSGIPHLSLTYEDDLIDPNVYPTTAHRLSEFLEIVPLQPAGSPVKLVHQDIADLVTNYDELSQALKRSDYAYLLKAN